MTRLLVATLVAALPLAVASCKDTVGPGNSGPPTAVSALSGDLQADTVGRTLPSPLVARVTDADGRNVAGVTVAFQVVDGGGAVSSASVVTDSVGRASTQWTLGTVAADTQRVVAEVGVGAGASVATATWRAVGRPGAPATLVLSPGVAQLDALGDTVRVAVEGADQHGNPIQDLHVAWSSTDAGIASVDGAGLVAAVANGTANVVARAGAAADTAVVTVQQVATSVALSADSVFLAALDDTLRLSASVVDGLGSPVAGASLAWSSGNAAVVTVDSLGLLRARANGQTVVVVSAGTGLSDSSVVAVAQIPRSVQTSVDSLVFVALGDTARVSATAFDENGNLVSDAGLVWHTRDSAVAVVNGLGRVTAEGNGSTFVVATVWSGYEDSLQVRVTQAIASVTLNADSAVFDAVGDTTRFAATVMDPGGAAVLRPYVVAWGVRDSTVASVDSAGLVSALADGDTWLLADVEGTRDSAHVRVTLPVPVASVAVTPASPLVAEGDTVRLTATANDAMGSPITDRVFTYVWASSDSSVAIPDSSGLVTALLAGAATISATTESVTGSTPVTVTTLLLVKIEGDGQVGLVGKPVNLPPAVRVEDDFTNPVEGVTVTFTPVGGGGVGAATAVSDAAGVARVTSWTLPGTPGAATLRAAIAEDSTTFSATAQNAAFDIVVRYFGSTTPSAAQQAAFEAAATRWETLVFGDLPDVAVNFGAQWCGSSLPDLPAINETVDDVIIYAQVTAIDGAGGILGQAGPCYMRSNNAGGLPYLGIMQFDEADLANLEASGSLGLVIQHEMGHVIGIGTLWGFGMFSGLLANPCPSVGTCTTDPYFTGAHALAAFDAVGGSLYTLGNVVPVENTGGAGTRNGHWRESVFDNELMTGFLDSGNNPLSIVTVGSLWDLGYFVNYADADGFAWSPSPPALRAGGALILQDDILRLPMRVTDEHGRVIRVIDPGP